MSRPPLWQKLRYTLPWIPSYVWQRCVRPLVSEQPVHLLIALANHFEPSMASTATKRDSGTSTQMESVNRWCREYPTAVNDWRDSDGIPLRHTYFYPAEEYDKDVIDRLAEFCLAGWGEIEIHLHHGLTAPDTSENTRASILEFRDALVARGCLSRENGRGSPRYAFVHGNWALANSARGRFCGVDDEMQILADTGCYADFTLPAPTCAQIRKINAMYECAMPLNMRAPHRRGIDLQCGRTPQTFPIIVQGPLLIYYRSKRGWPVPGIENGELAGHFPPTLQRLDRWRRAAISVCGRPDWVFIKLHCHSMNPDDESAMLGTAMQKFLRELVEQTQHRDGFRIHFLTAREMVNIILAACDGRAGNPGDYRDYRFQAIQRHVKKSP